jgi:hypothetical protein
VASQQLRHLYLAHAVFPYQRLNDPGSDILIWGNLR